MKNLRGVIRRVLNETKLRTYMKDWDDNILHMPTKIKMDKKEDGVWIPVEVSTRDFAELRNDPDYRPRNNNVSDAFRDFKESEPFLRDVKIALKNRSYAPSFDDFKETLIYADPFAINTARGHKPNDLKMGVKLLIERTFTQEERKIMVSNIQKSYFYEKKYDLKFLNSLFNELDDKIIDFYLNDKVSYYTVSSEDFANSFKSEINNTALNPKLGKNIAIKDFIKKILNDIYRSNNPDLNKISFGYSEDDKELVNAIIDYIKKELLFIYPNIHFVIYDNSNNKTNKIIINNY